MKLTRFSIEKYRSIRKTPWIATEQLTTLVGPNNEGKSNVLHGLRTVLSIIQEFPRISLYKGRIIGLSRVLKDLYSWDRDFPVGLRKTEPNGESVFNLEFKLDAKEIADFKKHTKSNLNQYLPIQIRIGKSEPGFKVTKPGKGAAALSGKAEEIAKFVGSKLDFKYIPAVRTAENAQEIIDSMVSAELRIIEKYPDYIQAIKAIQKLQKPILDKLADSIKTTVHQFLPQIKSLELTLSEEQLRRSLRKSCEIIVDDGSPTPLNQKGDGIQSLVALSMMRYSSEHSANGRNLILAVEEPESHLHPNAIHKLRDVLQEISKTQQLIITTHNPLFVNRARVPSNILVKKNIASPASNISEIREILGVKASDNLRNAELVLIVEGEDDRIALSAILSARFPKIRSAIESGSLAVDSLAGGSNLAYKLSLLRDSLCSVHCFLDYDSAGIKAFEKAEEEGLVGINDVHYALCQGYKESEFEDLLDAGLYEIFIFNKFGVKIKVKQFRGNKKKWSDRLKDTFVSQGKPWSDKVESTIKYGVADLVARDPANALLSHYEGSIKSLAEALAVKLEI